MERLAAGIQRIFWGLLKKMLVADRLNVLVKTVYDGYQNYDGTVIGVAGRSIPFSCIWNFPVVWIL